MTFGPRATAARYRRRSTPGGEILSIAGAAGQAGVILRGRPPDEDAIRRRDRLRRIYAAYLRECIEGREMSPLWRGEDGNWHWRLFRAGYLAGASRRRRGRGAGGSRGVDRTGHGPARRRAAPHPRHGGRADALAARDHIPDVPRGRGTGHGHGRLMRRSTHSSILAGLGPRKRRRGPIPPSPHSGPLNSLPPDVILGADAGHQEEEEVAERFAEAAARGSQQAKKDLAADAVLHGTRARGRGGLGDRTGTAERRKPFIRSCA